MSDRSDKTDATNIDVTETTNDYLKRECAKLNSELRTLQSEIKMLKETIVKMAMKQNGVVE